ncbi:hypothetical protein [Vibrio splendidus]|uniref:hypothetical protein n=1 Tax=Vibrio splendidus TaxID=29497 RepID=UPI0020A6166A|nr:hypothetical protein [Vibrio splendidus]
MKRLILNIIPLGSMNSMAHDSTVKYGIAISHDGEQIAYGKSGSGGYGANLHSQLELRQQFNTTSMKAVKSVK